MAHDILEDDPVAIAKFLSGSKINLLRPEKLTEYLKTRYGMVYTNIWQYIASSSRVLYVLTALQYKLEYSVNRKAIRLQDASYPAISGIPGTIRQRGRVVYELIVNKDAARADYLYH